MLLTYATPANADEGWVINSFAARIQVQPDGSLLVVETLLVDFRGLQKHGIFRDIPIVYDYDRQHRRIYNLNVRSVADASGRARQYATAQEGSFLRIKIGDPNATISGTQSYVISYAVWGTPNSFRDHDELFWNASGSWPVAMNDVSVAVTLPRAGIQKIACFQGPAGSTETCTGEQSGATATFRSTRVLPEQQQLTFVVGFDKGIIAEPAPRLQRRASGVGDFFEITPFILGVSAALLAGVLYALGWTWWKHGRDRRFLTVHYLTNDTAEEVAPILASDPIVIEYQPPEKLPPAIMGVLLDERADSLDATATIIDLAVRGHLHITEVDKKVLGVFDFGGNDWQFTRKESREDHLAPYEEKLLEGLFQDGQSVMLSDLKTKFASYLVVAAEAGVPVRTAVSARITADAGASALDSGVVHAEAAKLTKSATANITLGKPPLRRSFPEVCRRFWSNDTPVGRHQLSVAALRGSSFEPALAQSSRLRRQDER